MINIKVCKLSDLINKTLLVIGSFICLIIIYNFILKFIDDFSIDFIIYSLDKNFCVESNMLTLKDMMYVHLPINILNEDDIENEFNLADNNYNKKNNNGIWNNFNSFVKVESNIENETGKVNNGKNNGTGSNGGNSGKIDKTINILNQNVPTKITAPYLLSSEKISDSKYKIGNITINDYTKKKIDFDELEKALFTEIEKDCKVLIYHTHTSESYTGVENYSDSYRTEDNNSNVVKVGETLKEQLNNYGIYVRHDTTTHDYPSYNGAYKSSLKTVESILKNENYDIIIDVHRDALASNSKYRPTAEINGETVAKLMFVVGTNSAGLKHDNWIENLKFAVAVQQRAEEMYPGLFRDLHLSTSRYNQHTSNKSIILEVGATGNTIDEACLAMKYLASVLNAMKSDNY